MIRKVMVDIGGDDAFCVGVAGGRVHVAVGGLAASHCLASECDAVWAFVLKGPNTWVATHMKNRFGPTDTHEDHGRLLDALRQVAQRAHVRDCRCIGTEMDLRCRRMRSNFENGNTKMCRACNGMGTYAAQHDIPHPVGGDCTACGGSTVKP